MCSKCNKVKCSSSGSSCCGGKEPIYCGKRLTCIDVKQGDKFSDIMSKVNDFACSSSNDYTFNRKSNCDGFGLIIRNGQGAIIFNECFDTGEEYSFEDNPNCLDNGFIVRNGSGNVIYEKCFNNGCCDCSDLDVDFEMVLEGNGIKAVVTGGSGNYDYLWSVDMSPDPSESYPGFNPIPSPEQPDVFLSLGEDSFSDVAQTTDILVNVIATDTETNCRISKSFLYTNDREVPSEQFVPFIVAHEWNRDAPDFDLTTGECTNFSYTITPENGDGMYELTFIFGISILEQPTSFLVTLNNIPVVDYWNFPTYSVCNLATDGTSHILTLPNIIINANVGDVISLGASSGQALTNIGLHHGYYTIKKVGV